MPRRRITAVTWETVVDNLVAQKTRYIIRKKGISRPYIFLEDTNASRESRVSHSLNPLCWENIEDVIDAGKVCEWIANRTFPKSIPIPLLVEKARNQEQLNEDDVIYDWDQVMEIFEQYITKYLKASSAKNIRADIRNLRKAKTPFIWKKIKAWVYEKEISSRPFKNRLDALEQLRLAITEKFGDEPVWLMRSNLTVLRQQNNASRTKSVRYQPGADISGVRAIPTKEEAERYLDALSEEFELEQWCLAMLMCYGLRNHELHHCFPLKDNPNPKFPFLEIPGNWRTKSKYTHWTFPIFPDWIERYKLISRFQVMQDSLHVKAKPKIVSALDMSKPWDPSTSEKDRGVVTNNDYVGGWITNQMRKRLPSWFASVPNANGQHLKTYKKQEVTPYDLRHTWAVTLATDKRWEHVSDTDAAQAMGHDVSVHRKHYQKWINEEDVRDRFLERLYPSKEVA